MPRIRLGLPPRTRAFFSQELEERDLVLEYKELKELGKLPANCLFDQTALSDAMNEAASNVHRARMLHIKARRLADVALRDVKKTVAEVRKKAIKRASDWVHEYGARKQLSDQMVEDEIFRDETLVKTYNEALDRQHEVESLVDASKSLADAWKLRAELLQTQAYMIPKK